MTKGFIDLVSIQSDLTNYKAAFRTLIGAANDSEVIKVSGDQNIGGTKNFTGYFQVGYSGFNQGNTDIYKFNNQAQFVQYNASSQIYNLLRTDASNILGGTRFNGGVGVNSDPRVSDRGIIYARAEATSTNSNESAVVVEALNPANSGLLRALNDTGQFAHIRMNGSMTNNQFAATLANVGVFQTSGSEGMSIIASGGSNAHIRFVTVNSNLNAERMRITANGRTLIGLVSAMTDNGIDRLQVGGSASFAGMGSFNSSDGKFVQVSPDSGGQAGLRFFNTLTDATLRTTTTGGELKFSGTPTLTIQGNNAAGGVLKITDDPTYGIYTFSAEGGSASTMHFKAATGPITFTTYNNYMSLMIGPNDVAIPVNRSFLLCDYINGDLGGSVYLSWKGVQGVSPALQLGANDAAAPKPQIFQVQSVGAGTANTAGANFTIKGSSGTGTGVGGSIVFQVAPAGVSGTSKNAFVDAVTIAGTGNVLLKNALTFEGSSPSLTMFMNLQKAGDWHENRFLVYGPSVDVFADGNMGAGEIRFYTNNPGVWIDQPKFVFTQLGNIKLASYGSLDFVGSGDAGTGMTTRLAQASSGVLGVYQTNGTSLGNLQVSEVENPNSILRLRGATRIVEIRPNTSATSSNQMTLKIGGTSGPDGLVMGMAGNGDTFVTGNGGNLILEAASSALVLQAGFATHRFDLNAGWATSRTANGFRSRNFANNADAPITASAGTFSTGVLVGSGGGQMELGLSFNSSSVFWGRPASGILRAFGWNDEGLNFTIRPSGGFAWSSSNTDVSQSITTSLRQPANGTVGVYQGDGSLGTIKVNRVDLGGSYTIENSVDRVWFKHSGGNSLGMFLTHAGLQVEGDMYFGIAPPGFANHPDTLWKRVSSNVSQFVGGDGTTLGEVRASRFHNPDRLELSGTNAVDFFIGGFQIGRWAPSRLTVGSDSIQAWVNNRLSVGAGNNPQAVIHARANDSQSTLFRGTNVAGTDTFIVTGAGAATFSGDVSTTGFVEAASGFRASTLGQRIVPANGSWRINPAVSATYRNLGFCLLNQATGISNTPALLMEHDNGIGAISYFNGEMLFYNRSTAGNVTASDLAMRIDANDNLTLSTGTLFFGSNNGSITRTDASNTMTLTPSAGVSFQFSVHGIRNGSGVFSGSDGVNAVFRAIDRGGNSGAGLSSTLRGGNGSSSAIPTSGGPVLIFGGDAIAGNNNGGSVFTYGGVGFGTGTDGNVVLAHTGSAARGRVLVGKSTDDGTNILQVAGSAAFGTPATGLPARIDSSGNALRVVFDTTQTTQGFVVRGTDNTDYWTIGGSLQSGNQLVQLVGGGGAGAGQGFLNLGGGWLHVHGGPTLTAIRSFGGLTIAPAALGGTGGLTVNSSATFNSESVIVQRTGVDSSNSKGFFVRNSVGTDIFAVRPEPSAGTTVMITGSVQATTVASNRFSVTTDSGAQAFQIMGASGNNDSAYYGMTGIERSPLITHDRPGGVGLIVRGAVSQTANLQEWQNSAGTVFASISSGGNVTAERLFLGSDLGLHPVNSGASSVQTFWKMRLCGSTMQIGQAFSAANGPGGRDSSHVEIPLFQTNRIGLEFRGVASQTASFITAFNSSGTPVFDVSNAGNVTAGATTFNGNVTIGGAGVLPWTLVTTSSTIYDGTLTISGGYLGTRLALTNTTAMSEVQIGTPANAVAGTTPHLNVQGSIYSNNGQGFAINSNPTIGYFFYNTNALRMVSTAAAQVVSNNGMQIRNAANDADAPITASAAAFSATVRSGTMNDGFRTDFNSGHIAGIISGSTSLRSVEHGFVDALNGNSWRIGRVVGDTNFYIQPGYTSNGNISGSNGLTISNTGAITAGAATFNGNVQLSSALIIGGSAYYEQGRIWKFGAYQIHSSGFDTPGTTQVGNQYINFNSWTGSEYVLDIAADSSRWINLRAGGVRVRSSNGLADGPITASNGTFSGLLSVVSGSTTAQIQPSMTRYMFPSSGYGAGTYILDVTNAGPSTLVIANTHGNASFIQGAQPISLRVEGPIRYSGEVRDQHGIGIRSQAGYLNFYEFNTVGSNVPSASIGGGGFRVLGKTIIGTDNYGEVFGAEQLLVKGSMRATGAINCEMQPNAFNAGNYSALIVGATSGSNASNGGLFAFGRFDKSTKPFTGLCGWDDGGGGRYLYFGGGGWQVPDPNDIGFWTAPNYNETSDQGIVRLGITRSGTVNVNPSAFNAPIDATSTFNVRQLTTSNKGIVVRGLAGQVGNAVEVQDSTTGVVASISPTGSAMFSGNIALTSASAGQKISFTYGGHVTEIRKDAYYTDYYDSSGNHHFSSAGGLGRGTITASQINQGFNTHVASARFRMLAAGSRVAEVYHSGSASWQIAYSTVAGAGGATLGLYDASPVPRATTAQTPATHAAGSGTTLRLDDTFDGYTIAQIVAALRALGALT